MAGNEQSDSTTNQVDLEVKAEPFEPDATSLQFNFIPLHMSPKPEIQINNEPNEKNGQKRIQTAPIEALIDVTSKKPRINTTEDVNIQSAKAVGDETALNKKGGGDEIDLNKKGGGDEIVLKEKGGGDETDLNKKGGGDETDLNKKGGGDETDLNKKGGGDETDLNKKGGGDETDLNKKGGGDETDLNKKGGGDETDLNKKPDRDEMDIDKRGVKDEMDQSSVTAEYYLTVNNLPSDWTYVQIKNYLDQECGHVDEMEILTKSAIRLTFQNLEKCSDAFKKLQNKFVRNEKLRVMITDVYTTFPTDLSSNNQNGSIEQTISNKIIASTRWRPDLDCWDIDPEGLYGLRPEFLKSLGLQPPLNKIVHVTNFRCDKAELKEVMEMAGNVLLCCVVPAVTKYAKFIYSHPLEAVQAISMLNGQMLYGTPLKITMDKNPEESVVLPKGLAGIGQGLGMRARPIRNIVQQYHRYANKQTSAINPILFSEIDFSDGKVNKTKTEDNPEEIEKKINEFVTSRPGCNISNPTVHLKLTNIDKLDCPDSMDESDCVKIATKTERGGEKYNVGSPQGQIKNGAEKQQSNSPLLATQAKPSPGLMYLNMVRTPPVPMHNPSPMPGPREPFFRPGNPQERFSFRPRVPFMPPPRQGPPFLQPRPPFRPEGMRPQIPPTAICRPPRANVENCVTIKLSNMPPSTTFPLLCDLLAQCGQVMAVQLTTPGCAMATFSHPSHAERCFQKFNGMNLDGYIIKLGFA